MMVTREADYAIRVVLYLSGIGAEEVASSAEMADAMSIPYRFLRNIIRRMVDAGLVVTRRGKGGGVSLARPPVTISLFEVLTSIDPTMTRLNICLNLSHTCSRQHECTVHPELSRIQKTLDEALEQVTFDKLA